MLGRLAALFPFQTPEGKRLAVLFAIVYFAQGMWYLPVQVVTISLKDRGLSAGQVADFFAITIIPWLIKPVYGLISDFVPLVYNVGTQASQNVGGRLYDHLGYLPLVLISTGMTAATWLLVPLVKIDRIEARAKQAEVPAT
jgi:predicted MFS family arabinose efflux permease